MLSFEVSATSERARAGVVSTAHGSIETPAFMPVATHAAVKSLTPEELDRAGLRLLIMNTYHLWLRPGPEVIQAHGGLHAFSRWPFSIATDSGGFQAYSLGARTVVTEDGIEFSSHLDGSRWLLTPERSMELQAGFGSDIAMPLDICPPAEVTRADLVAAVERTTRWAIRSLEARRPGQAVFGIVQGGAEEKLRRDHAERLGALPFEGLALGGFSVGEPPETMHRVLETVAPNLDPSRPRYLMGVGTPLDLVRAIGSGIDLFDCVLPTRNARNGYVFLWSGKLVIKNARYRLDIQRLDPECDCAVCEAGYSRAYLRHAYLAGEILAHRLLTLHNLSVYARLMREARRAVLSGDYQRWALSRVQAFSNGLS